MNKDSPEFSIIIPFKTWSTDLDECLEHLMKMDDSSWEIILLPDIPTDIPQSFLHLPISIIPTSAVSPALKRDQGAEVAQGTFLAFIDDDAYPFPDWLKKAANVFLENPDLCAVGGPAITPATDSFWSRVSGAVFLSTLGGGFPERYVPIPPSRYVDDWPSVNLIVRKDIFLDIGGFDSAFWPGEDTNLCRDITGQGWKILYAPDMKVFHHRRASLKKHTRQVGNYGFHRGYFARHYPENSRKPVFFIPSIFVIFLSITIPFSYIFSDIIWLIAAGGGAYGLALIKVFIDIVKYESPLVSAMALPYVFITHIWYGIRFMAGLSTRKYKGSLNR